MKPIVGVLVFSAVFVLPIGSSFAQDSKTTVIVPSITPATADATPETLANEKMVCKAPRPMMGTRFPGPRICKTQHQWNAEHYEAKEDLEKMQNRGCLSSGVCRPIESGVESGYGRCNIPLVSRKLYARYRTKRGRTVAVGCRYVDRIGRV